MVQRIDNSDKHYKPHEYTEIKINNSKETHPIKNFIKEFFYDRLIQDDTFHKGFVIVKDGAHDIFYELMDFSKTEPEMEFSLRFLNRNNKKTTKLFKIKNGSFEQVKDYIKKTPNKNNSKKPLVSQSKTKPKIEKTTTQTATT